MPQDTTQQRGILTGDDLELRQLDDEKEAQPVVFSVVLSSLLPIDDMVAELTLASGEQRLIVLRAGQYEGLLPAAVVRLQLTAQPAPTGERALDTASPSERAEEAVRGPILSMEELFENGTKIDGNRLKGQLRWGLHCHTPVTLVPLPSEHAPAGGDLSRGGLRFGSFEHITCADEIGFDAKGRTLSFSGRRAPFNRDTKLTVGPHSLTFGEIVALAGDYYAHLDKQAAQEFKDAWPHPTGAVLALAGDYREPVLCEDTTQIVDDILKTTYRNKNASQSKLSEAKSLATGGLFGNYPVRRYLALASQNFCHFASQPATGALDDEANEALRWYLAYHKRALELAGRAHAAQQEEHLFEALVIDAFACHFLTDQFATGHMRVPRRKLGERFGVFRGALGMAHEMHCEDNMLGLWLTTRHPHSPRLVWRGYGDTMLFIDEAKLHLKQIKEAVRRSTAEIFARACGVAIGPSDAAEAMIPVALPAGEAPAADDVYPSAEAGQPAGSPNHFPKYCWVKDRDLVARRVGPPERNAYINQDGNVGATFALSFAGFYPTLVS